MSPALPGYPQTVPGGTTTHTINGLDPNRSYTVRVRAFGTTGPPADPVFLPLDLQRACVPDVSGIAPWICQFREFAVQVPR